MDTRATISAIRLTRCPQPCVLTCPAGEGTMLAAVLPVKVLLSPIRTGSLPVLSSDSEFEAGMQNRSA